jgi:hypothetical protein
MKLSQKQKKALEYSMYAKTRQHYSNLEIANAAKTLLSMKKKRSRSPTKKRSPKKSSKKRSPKKSPKKSRADKLRHAAQLWRGRQGYM